MSIGYGDSADLAAPTAEIISDFHQEYQDRDLEEALWRAAGKWAGRAETLGAAADGKAGDASAEVTSGMAHVVVSGRQRPAPVLRLGEFSAFQVTEEGVLVTVVARHMGVRFPDVHVSD